MVGFRVALGLAPARVKDWPNSNTSTELDWNTFGYFFSAGGLIY